MLFLGHSVHICPNLLQHKTAGRRVKQGEIWDTRTLVTHIWCTLDLVFKVSLVSLCTLVFQDNLYLENGSTAKWTEIWNLAGVA